MLNVFLGYIVGNIRFCLWLWGGRQYRTAYRLRNEGRVKWSNLSSWQPAFDESDANIVEFSQASISPAGANLLSTYVRCRIACLSHKVNVAFKG